MQIILASAKIMNDRLKSSPDISLSSPRFQNEADSFARDMAQYSTETIADMLGCSQQIAAQNRMRYMRFFEYAPKLPAILAYHGQAYKHLKAETLNVDDLNYSQQKLWITSFLYGLLRPLDAILPYRMEGNVGLPSGEGHNMFGFWKSRLTDVPEGSKVAYQNAEYWRNFTNVVVIGESHEDKNIIFADAAVKTICVTYWDINRDGELSENEAAAVTDLGDVFKNNTEIHSFDELKYFTRLSSIGNLSFYFCTNLKSIIIPNSVKRIGSNAFNDCYSLNNITIGELVTNIGDCTFLRCNNLNTITSLNPTPPQIGNYTFPSYTATLQVSSGSKTAYQNAEYWKNFTNIVEIDPSGIQSITLDKDINSPLYDLNGRKLKEPSKGVNIIGGKKVLLK